MYRKFKERKSSSRSRSREKKAIDDPDTVAMERAQREGNAQVKEQADAPEKTLNFTPGNTASFEKDSFNPEFRRGSSKDAIKTPIKSLVNKELSKEMESRRSSTSVVARLMGINALPSPVNKHDKERGISYQKTLEAYPLHMSNNGYQQCKDVFEVMEMPKFQRQINKPIHKGISNLEQSGTDLAFTEQKFGDATHLLSGDEFHYCKEYDDSSDDLDSTEDRYVKFLHEPRPVFKKPLHDLNCSHLSPHERHFTILKPSIVAKSDNELSSRVKRNNGRQSKSVTGDINLSSKPLSNLVSHSVKDHISEPLYEEKNKGNFLPNPIVILKPNLKEVWGPAWSAPLARSPENDPYHLRRQETISMSRRSEIYDAEIEWHRLSDISDLMGNRAKRCREIAIDITKNFRASGSSRSKMIPASKNNGYISDESSHDMTGTEILTSLNSHSNRLSTLSYYSTKSSVSKEARKCLYERWKMMQQIHEVGPVSKESGCLGEMLISNREIPRTTLNKKVVERVSGEKAVRDEAARYKDRWFGNLSRSRSLSAPYSVYENHRSYFPNVLSKFPYDLLDRNDNQKRRSSIQISNYHHHRARFYSGGEEREMSEREIHVNSEELHDINNARRLGAEVCINTEPSNNSVAGRGHEAGNLAPQCIDAKFHVIVEDQQVQQTPELAVQVNDGEFYEADPNRSARKEISDGNLEINSSSSDNDISESPSPTTVGAIEDVPSPVSVLELPPSEEDKPSSECFEQINSALKELRMQINLLKSESRGTDARDLELLIYSDEDIGGEILEAFKDDEDRDFSYLLDVLIDSGVNPTSANGPFYGEEVFEKLEKKYVLLSSWLRSERKLLFDLISSILVDIMKLMKCCLTWAREGLVEEVWQMVVKQRNFMSNKLEDKHLLDTKWLDLEDDVNMIGMELERMVIDDIIEELLYPLI